MELQLLLLLLLTAALLMQLPCLAARLASLPELGPGGWPLQELTQHLLVLLSVGTAGQLDQRLLAAVLQPRLLYVDGNMTTLLHYYIGAHLDDNITLHTGFWWCCGAEIEMRSHRRMSDGTACHAS